ncbi:MAG: hypothetical protein JWL63_3414 [Rhodocyclales bacterium]|nr:hypothetical protein [Rhodocyclales bacterium]
MRQVLRSAMKPVVPQPMNPLCAGRHKHALRKKPAVRALFAARPLCYLTITTPGPGYAQCWPKVSKSRLAPAAAAFRESQGYYLRSSKRSIRSL